MASPDDSVARTEPITEAIAEPSSTGAVSDVPSKNPDKFVDEEQSTPELQPADATVIPEKKSPAKETASRKGTTAKPAVKSAAPKQTAPKAAAGAAAPAKRPVTKPVGPARATGSATRPTQSSSAAAKKPAPVKTGASDTGFIKPKPKSPTKPLNLPSSLMAATASSVSKTGGSRLSTSRQSGNLPQSASAHSIGAAASSNGVKRQSSVANRTRPSLGVPPSRLSQQESSKRQSQVDDGFLARMMRPTQSSSSKTADKSETTPPKETTARPSLSAPRHGAQADSKSSSKSPVNKRSDSATHSRATPTPSTKPAAKPTSTKSRKADPEKTSNPAPSEPPKPRAAETKGPEFVADNPIVSESDIVQSSSGGDLMDKLRGLSIEDGEPSKATEEAPETPPSQELEQDLPSTEPAEEPVKESADEPVVEQHAEAEPERDDLPEQEIDIPVAEDEGAETEPQAPAVAEPELDQEVEAVEADQQEPKVDEDEPEILESEPDVAAEPEPEPETLEEAALDAAQVETSAEAIDIADEADPVHETVASEAAVQGDEDSPMAAEAVAESEPLVSIDANHAGRKSATHEEEAETDDGPSSKTAASTVPADKAEATEEGN